MEHLQRLGNILGVWDTKVSKTSPCRTYILVGGE